MRAIVRDADKAAAWAARGCEIAVADVNDAKALAKAFSQTEGAFVMLPPTFDPAPGFPEARRAAANLSYALNLAKPGRIVALSSLGSQVVRPNLLNQLHILEECLGKLSLPLAFVRPAWFMENSAWDIPNARKSGMMPSFLQPLDKSFPMIATEDMGQVATELLTEESQATGIVEIEGPCRISPNDIAATLAHLLHREVRAIPIPRDNWETVLRGQEMKNPVPRMQMLDGFNEGWLEFESSGAGSRKTQTTLNTALRSLIHLGISKGNPPL